VSRLYVAFLWHHHQPHYRYPAAARFALPWVRLHAIKDYVGMANLLAEFPRVHQTVNIVPSLLRQVEEYLAGATDDDAALARRPADELTDEHRVEILRTFFMANWENMIRPRPRYRHLLARCEAGRRSLEQTARAFSSRDFRDLQVWANLAWFHPTVVEKDERLRRLIEKGEGFTEEEKALVLDRQLETMAEIVPLHRRLAEAGRLELTTSPFYHPVVPLLCDPAAARTDRPELELPHPMPSAREDALAQTERALAFHERAFGARPRGLWPPEGAVSGAAAAVFAEAGAEWIVTDEQILAQTLGSAFGRDERGVVDRPDRLHRPWRVRCGSRELTVLFRDQALSDLIGFRYHLRPPADAARDLVDRLGRIRERAPDNALVVIALDGENCWEFYPDQGVGFLRDLYARLSDTTGVRTICISEYLDRFGVEQELESLYAGSWIAHGFAPWIGHWEKNRAWEHLARAKAFRDEQVQVGAVPEDRLAAAAEELHVAEGSDWFWWYGDDHSTGNDPVFDALFRGHLRRVYELLGARPPDELLRPVTEQPVRESWRPPRALLNVTVDGRRTSFFEWLGAGTYERPRDLWPMQRSQRTPVGSARFGFGRDAFFLRLDLEGACREPEAELGIEVAFGAGEDPALAVTFAADGAEVRTRDPAAGEARAARGRAAELAAPLASLGLEPGGAAELVVRVFEAGSVVQRIPTGGSIPLVVPKDPDSAYPGVEDFV